MTIPNEYPQATQKPVSYRGEAGTFSTPPIGWVMHVQMGLGSPYSTFENAAKTNPPNRRFSHLWVSKAGDVEQYQTFDAKAWAAVAGNSLWWHVEFEGFDTEPLTDMQILRASQIHKFLGAPNRITDNVSVGGIGTHVMGGVPWGNHSCPGTIRAAQRSLILAKVVNVPPANPPRPPAYPAFPGTIRQGYTGPAVLAFQKRLLARGWKITPDGKDGPVTTGIIKSFQAEKHLTVDGVGGPETWAALWLTPVTS